MTALNHYKKEAKDANIPHLTCFSGDMLSPSLISSVVYGEQFVKPFNAMSVDVACLGNHELDFGLKNMKKVLDQTMPPNGTCNWVVTNMVE